MAASEATARDEESKPCDASTPTTANDDATHTDQPEGQDKTEATDARNYVFAAWRARKYSLRKLCNDHLQGDSFIKRTLRAAVKLSIITPPRRRGRPADARQASKPDSVEKMA